MMGWEPVNRRVSDTRDAVSHKCSTIIFTLHVIYCGCPQRIYSEDRSLIRSGQSFDTNVIRGLRLDDDVLEFCRSIGV